MKVSPIAAPEQAAGTQASQANLSARDRAIARLMTGGQNQSQTEAVANPNSVSPEEMSAVKAPESTETEAEPEKQADTSEGSQPDEATSKTEKQPLSAQYAQLARKEKAIRQQAQDVKAKEAALLAREQALQAKETEYSNPSQYITKAELMKNPMKVLLDAGVTYDQITQQALNAPSAEESQILGVVESLKAEIAELKGETQKQKQAGEDQQKQAYEQAVKLIEREAKTLIESDPEFETIKETGSLGDVVELIKKTFDEEGILMTVEEAAKAVEEELLESIVKYSSLKKVQSKLRPAGAPPAPGKQDPAAPKQTQPPKTLTNSMGSQPKLSARERAIAAFEANRKK